MAGHAMEDGESRDDSGGKWAKKAWSAAAAPQGHRF